MLSLSEAVSENVLGVLLQPTSLLQAPLPILQALHLAGFQNVWQIVLLTREDVGHRGLTNPEIGQLCRALRRLPHPLNKKFDFETQLHWSLQHYLRLGQDLPAKDLDEIICDLMTYAKRTDITPTTRWLIELRRDEARPLILKHRRQLAVPSARIKGDDEFGLPVFDLTLNDLARL